VQRYANKGLLPNARTVVAKEIVIRYEDLAQKCDL